MKQASPLSSTIILDRNQFLGKVRSSWKNAFKLSHLLPKDHAPVRLIFPNQDHLFFDNAHRAIIQNNMVPTDFKIRIDGKGMRRIYIGYEIRGYKWDQALNGFYEGLYKENCDGHYFCVIDGKIIVLIIDLPSR
jgi:hypothetical protein